MILFFDNGCGVYPNKNAQYVGNIVYCNLVSGNENFIRMVVSDQNVIDFFKSWEKDIINSTSNVTIKKTIYLMDGINSIISCVSSYIKNFQKDCGWWSFKPIVGAYEVILLPKYTESLSRSYYELLESIMINDIRDERLDKIFNNK